MVIAVVVAVVLAAVIGGYFALRPKPGQARHRSELRTLQDPPAGAGPPSSKPAATPSSPAVAPTAAPAPPPDPVPAPAPAITPADAEDSHAEVVDAEVVDEVEYEIVEVVEYVEVDDEDDVDDPDEVDDADEEAGGPAGEPDDVNDVVTDDEAVEAVDATDVEPAVEPTVEVIAAVDADDHEEVDVDEGVVEAARPAPEHGGSSDGSSETGEGSPLAEVIELDDPDDGASLAAVVAELIDAADPEVADVMARLIDASDPEVVAHLVDEPDLEVAEVVARLVDAADPAVAALVAELAEAPDRRDVAEVLRLVDTAYGTADGTGEIPPEVAAKLDELDIEADLELTSRPGDMSGFAHLSDQDKLRVIIRVLCGLVGREDLPPPRRGPRNPASLAEHRMWPLSRARWPVPPPTAGAREVPEGPLPARRQSTKAS